MCEAILMQEPAKGVCAATAHCCFRLRGEDGVLGARVEADHDAEDRHAEANADGSEDEGRHARDGGVAVGGERAQEVAANAVVCHGSKNADRDVDERRLLAKRGV